MSIFTENQLLGINKEGTNILISAGAGSGKTTVLTQRIVRKLLDGINIDQLLVLTFTNAAAAEMKERIKKEIQKNDNLKNQLSLVEIAPITTFDAYLLMLVEKYSYAVDINSNLSIGDSVLLEKILTKIIDDKFDELYKEANTKKDLFITGNTFLSNYFVFDDSTLKDNIKLLYYKYKNILKKEEINQTFIDSQIEVLFSQYENILFQTLKDMKVKLQQLSEVYTDKKGQKIVLTFIEKYSFINVINKYDDFVLLVQENKSVRKTTANIENKELIVKYQEQINDLYKSIKDRLIFKSKKEIIKKEQSLYPLKDFILNMLQQIDKSYFEQKREYNLFEFSDVTNLAIQILQNKRIQEEVKNSFNEILIDEYQDTNDFQNHFIELISNNNVYLVGDVKQSIYGFRNANPQNFNELGQMYKKKEVNGEVISLIDNFRSREEVLQSVNYIFEKLMHKDYSDIDYSDNHALNYGNKTYENKLENHDYMMEFLNYEPTYFKEVLKIEKLKNNYYEPLIIVNDIVTKIKNKFQVLDAGSLRDVQYKDFAILTKTKSSYKYYNEVFEFYNIPIDIQMEQYVNDNQNYELLVLINILKLIQNPCSKILEVSILRSFLYRTDDNDIHDYVQKGKTCNDSLNLKEKIDLIKQMQISNLGLLINEIFDKFKFFDKMVFLANTIGINERLIKILDVADNFTNSGKSINDLIEYLEYSLLDTEQKVEIEQTLPSANNVKLMTIHKSKGLEYNIVYLPDLNKDLYKTDKININLTSELGLILPNIKDYQKEDSFLHTLSKLNIHNQMVDENIRLLYVAMTRAKEQIIFVSNKEKEAKNSSTLKSYESIKKYSDLIYALKDIKDNYNKEVLKFEYINVEDFISRDENREQNKPNIKNNILHYEYKNIEIDKKQMIKTTFSKSQTEVITSKQRQNIDLGNYLHEQLEQINIKKLNDKQYLQEIFQYIDLNIYEQSLLKDIITNISKLEFIKDIVNYWTEYEFYYEQKSNKTIGIIDLLIETTENIYIIDYKLNDIEVEAYYKQLLNYKKVIKQYFDKNIKCYLYSLLQNEIKEINDSKIKI